MPTYRLTPVDVLRARKLWRQGWTKVELASEFGVASETVFSAVRGHTWPHLPGACPTGIKFKLTAEKVRRARELWQEGWTTVRLAKRYKVSKTAMSNALLGQTWKDAAGELASPHDSRGTGARSARMTEEDVREARQRYREGASMKALGERFGVSTVAMMKAIRGQTWSHVPGAVQGRSRAAELARGRKLTAEKAREIRRRKERGEAVAQIAREFGVTGQSVRDVVAGRTWSGDGRRGRARRKRSTRIPEGAGSPAE